MGWKGVGVAEALGAAVTNTNGNAGGAGAAVAHPASPALSIIEAIELARMNNLRPERSHAIVARRSRRTAG